MSNFSFLNKYWPELGEYVEQAEQYVYSDSNALLMKQRILDEKKGDKKYIRGTT